MQINVVKEVNPISRLIGAILLLASGICLIFLDTETISVIIIPLIMIGILYYAIVRFIRYCDYQRFAYAIIQLVVSIFISAVLAVFAQTFYSILHIVLAVLAFAIAVLRVLIALHLHNVEGPGVVSNIFSAVICILFGLSLLVFGPQLGNAFVFLVSGIYLILFSLTFFSDFITAVTKKDLNNKSRKRKVTFALPNFVTALTSTEIVNRYDKVLEENDNMTEIIDVKKGCEDQNVNFSVMIHVSQILAKRMGHVDISIGDTVYTYGCYDSSTNKLGGFISKGTFVVLPKEPYLENCLTQQRKYVVEYGCNLTDEQLDAVKNAIKEVFKHTTKKELSYNPKDDLSGNDGANTVAKLGGELYYVDDGPFKTYFAISTNCVQLADLIIGEAGLDEMSSNSLKTPGAYYTLMENQFYRANSRVIRRKVHLQTTPGEKRLIKEQIEKAKAEKKD